MNRDWESTFNLWSTGPSKSEETRIENTEKMIRNAINSSEKLKDRDITIFVQGSYRNRVNVRQDSDIDIGVLCKDIFFPVYPDENVKSILNAQFSDSTYDYAKFKNELYEALVSKFGSNNVSRGDKAIDIHENTYHVEADVAAFIEHRRYTSQSSYLSGVVMRPDSGNPYQIINWPEQHYNNGVQKNSITNRRYKRIVRILKKLRNEMEEVGIVSCSKISGFLIECLVWNVPNDKFGYSTYYLDLRASLVYLLNNTISEDKCIEWGEVSELKYLLKGTHKYTWKDVHKFISDAWDYVGYE